MITLGKVHIHGDVAMSPMAGVSDSPTRLLARKMGSAFSYSEFVSTDHIIVKNPKAWDLLRFQEAERPFYFQIFGSKVSTVVAAARMIAPLQPDVIDLNMGCSVSKVAHRGSGAGLLRNLSLAGKMIEGIRKETELPVTAKVRIGWNHHELNYLETLHVLQESGVSAISVHGRTKEMGYTGVSDWEIIGEIKSRARVPIFGNGDVGSWEEAQERRKQTQVDLVLIGRKSIGNPWVFQPSRPISAQEWYSVVVEHLESVCDHVGEERYGVILFRKYLTRYLDLLPLFLSSEAKSKQEFLRIENKTELVSLLQGSIESEPKQVVLA